MKYRIVPLRSLLLLSLTLLCLSGCPSAVAPGTTTTTTTTTTVAPVKKSANADLSSLGLSSGTLSPAFSSSVTTYTAFVPYSVTSLTVTAKPADSNASVKTSGGESLAVGPNAVTATVSAQDGVTVKKYTVSVNRENTLAITLVIEKPADIPVVLADELKTLTRPATLTVTTALENVSAYRWLLDGVEKSSASSYTVDSVQWAPGVIHVLTLVVTIDGLNYSGALKFRTLQP